MKKTWLFVCVGLAACRYTMSDFLPDHVHSVAIAPVISEVPLDFEWEIERVLNEAVRDAFILDNSLRVVPGGAADSRLEVRIVGFEHETAGVPDEDGIVEISISYRFLDAVKGQVINHSDRLAEAADLADTGDADAMIEPIAEISDALARELVQQTLRGW